QKHAVRSSFRGNVDAIVHQTRRHTPPAGQGDDVVLGKGFGRDDRVFVRCGGPAEIGEHALQCIAAPATVGASVLGDQLVGYQRFQLVAKLLVEPADVNELLVDNLCCFLWHDL